MISFEPVHRARNLRELLVELAVQHTVMICANTSSRLYIQPIIIQIAVHLFQNILLMFKFFNAKYVICVYASQ